MSFQSPAHGSRAVASATAILHPHVTRATARPHGVSAPIDRSATFRLDDESEAALASGRGYEHLDIYGRYGGPTQRAAAEAIAALEGAEAALLLSSGIAAIRLSITSMLPPQGGRILAARSIYGATESFLSAEGQALGRQVERFDVSQVDELAALLEQPADLIYLETLSNPCLEVAALPEVCALANAAGVPVLLDATFGGGMNHRPLAHGVALVIHSATKYLNGHSDVIAGAVAGTKNDVDRIQALVVRHGSCIDPSAAWLLLRGLKTLPVRWRAQVQSARQLAGRLATHPAVRRVMYPGVTSGQEASSSPRPLPLYLSDGGAMLAFDVGDAASARAVADALEIITHGTSLGGVESLISIPARSSHASLSPAVRSGMGIADGLLRLSVGLEDLEDLWSDLKRALEVGEPAAS